MGSSRHSMRWYSRLLWKAVKRALETYDDLDVSQKCLAPLCAAALIVFEQAGDVSPHRVRIVYLGWPGFLLGSGDIAMVWTMGELFSYSGRDSEPSVVCSESDGAVDEDWYLLVNEFKMICERGFLTPWRCFKLLRAHPN
jgi:hypothetical protein